MSKTLTQFARQFLSTDRAAFIAGLKAPVLVWEPPMSGVGFSAEGWQSTGAGQQRARPTNGHTLVFSVEKLPVKANAFAMGITLGRIDTNDIVVDDATISRFHAFLQHDDRRGIWSLSDADSKNGTWVGLNKVGQNLRVPLVDGDSLRFGEVKMRFFLPGGFATLIESLAKAG